MLHGINKSKIIDFEFENNLSSYFILMNSDSKIYSISIFQDLHKISARKYVIIVIVFMLDTLTTQLEAWSNKLDKFYTSQNKSLCNL